MRLIDRRQLLIGAGACGLVPLAGSAYAIGVEPMLAPVVTTYRLTPPGWPEGLRLRIAAIADIHACEPWMSVERIASIALATNALAPDLTVLLGDFNAGHRYVTAPVLPADWGEALAPLRAPLGVYAVLGNHDWWHGPLPQTPGGPDLVRAGLRQAKIPVLENQAIALHKDGKAFWLAGLADQLAHLRSHGWAQGADDVAGTLKQTRDGEPILLLMHEPFLFRHVPERVSLTLCGHTHGGQVNIPFLGTPFSPSNRYNYGHIVEGGRHLIVSAGLGESGAPVRFRVPPEIVVIELGGEPAVA